MFSSNSIAISYIRYSTPEQSRGNSYARQLKQAEDYCNRKGLKLVEGKNYFDDGVSGFSGKNRIHGELKNLLEDARNGVIKSGSTLIIESLDRLGRDNIFAQMDVFRQILDAGLKIVVLSCGEMEYTHDNAHDIGTLLGAIMVMARAHDESRMKSFRGKENWKLKRANAKEKPLTSIVPKWIISSQGRFELIPKRAEIIKEIFEMAAQGHGRRAITIFLNKRKEPIWSSLKQNSSQIWQDSYISKILHNRSVIGEYQAHTKVDGKRLPVGDPFLDYFPRVISDELFYRVQCGLSSRINRGGRSVHKAKNLFSGLLKCAICGGAVHFEDKSPHQYLVCRRQKLGANKCNCSPIPYLLFERSILQSLTEIDWTKIGEIDLLKPVTPIQSEEALTEQIREVKERIDNLVDCIAEGNTLHSIIIPKIEELQSKQHGLCELLETVRIDKKQRAETYHLSVEGLRILERAIEGCLSPTERIKLKTSLNAILSFGYVLKSSNGIVLSVIILKNNKVVLVEHSLSGQYGSVVIDQSRRLEVLPGALKTWLPVDQAKFVLSQLSGAA